eukprot:sb/3470786/
MATVLFERDEKNQPAKPGGSSKSPYLRRTQWVRYLSFTCHGSCSLPYKGVAADPALQARIVNLSKQIEDLQKMVNLLIPEQQETLAALQREQQEQHKIAPLELSRALSGARKIKDIILDEEAKEAQRLEEERRRQEEEARKREEERLRELEKVKEMELIKELELQKQKLEKELRQVANYVIYLIVNISSNSLVVIPQN